MGPFAPTSVTGPFASTTSSAATMADHSAPTTARPAPAALGTALAGLFPPTSAFSTLGYPLSTAFPSWPAAAAPAPAVPPLPMPSAGMVDPSSFLLGVQSAQAAFAQLLAAVGGGAGFPLDLAGRAGVAPTDLVNRFPTMMAVPPAAVPAAANPVSGAMDSFPEPLFPLPTFPTAPAAAAPPPPLPATAPATGAPPAPAPAPAARFPHAFLHTTDPPLASASFCDPHAGGRIQSPADLHAWLALGAPAAAEPRRDWIPPPTDPAAMLDIEDFLMLDDDHVAAPAVAIGFDEEDVKMDVPVSVPVEVAMEELVLDAAAPRNADPFLFAWPSEAPVPVPAPPPPPTAMATDENPVCAHCGITKTPLWRRGDNDEMLCNACGLYFRQHKRARPRALHATSAAKLASAPATPPPQCANCETSVTSLWRRAPDGKPLCNACGLHFKQHGTHRAASRKSTVIKRRARQPRRKKDASGSATPVFGPTPAPGGGGATEW
ncbi:hypothetical protein AMAG_09627 [Allomyces macrogynus ATCC 38327]|uniref:GATA-type domain-containing protein n=1 Tax=Allomyces macrogynus (strain ATCC 38327) TaxID=578462 RepID=A0A0L0STC4_ALLM3|nr:hypothetical protein AMAG_09627 [Allomyces macrogynus ATCC 38327]|eukprot:KNE65645.1 hypothetical protein AMAG_09627 [Allomyces macrogynus ATCC 38327]